LSYDHCRRITPWADKPTTYGSGGVDSPIPARMTRVLLSILTSQPPRFRYTASGVAGSEPPVGLRKSCLADILAGPSAQMPAIPSAVLRWDGHFREDFCSEAGDFPVDRVRSVRMLCGVATYSFPEPSRGGVTFPCDEPVEPVRPPAVREVPSTLSICRFRSASGSVVGRDNSTSIRDANIG
jgi:hypothetical protein